jgi:uncharacterized protein YjbJ (UPF0337 family)
MPFFMKNRTHQSSELKGVVKRTKGKLTNRPDLKSEGDAEMLGKKRANGNGTRRKLNPDPHRRG